MKQQPQPLKSLPPQQLMLLAETDLRKAFEACMVEMHTTQADVVHIETQCGEHGAISAVTIVVGPATARVTTLVHRFMEMWTRAPKKPSV